MTTFFTADHHFGHGNIIRYSNRPFSDVDEMDDTLIAKWNEVVGPKDEVYYIGDFTLLNDESADRYFEQLNGRIYVLPGSHDRWITRPTFQPNTKNDYVRILPSLHSLDGLIKSFDGHDLPIVLCHYAMRSWDRSHYGSWHLFGHHHGSLPSYGLSFDIGVDCWDFYPVPFEKVKDKMATLEPVVDYSKRH